VKIIVKAKARAKMEKVELLTQPTLNFDNAKPELDIYKVWVKEPPVGGLANQAIVKALAKHFDIAPSCVVFVSGQTAKQKIFEITEY
jgi:uncharacterized protein YggU (UPF0235/DUF167 family)